MTREKRGTGRDWASRNLFRPEEQGPREPRVSAEAAGPEGFLRGLRAGEPWRQSELEVLPLLLEGDRGEPPVLLTSQAVASGLLEIVERGEGGVVQQLVAWNKGGRPVAILEGDTLVGCKQNRVVAHSIVIAAGTSAPVPVGCMERGRWSHESASFEVGTVRIAPSVRARTVREMKAARSEGRAVALDQSRLWRDVDEELSASGVSSPTSDYYELVERRGRDARQRARDLALAPGQVGVLVVRNGSFVGLEAAGHPALWSAICEPTLASYLMGAHRGSVSGVAGRRASAREWLSHVQSASVRTSPGLAMGSDVDVDGPGVAGVGIALDAFPIHLAVFSAQSPDLTRQ